MATREELFSQITKNYSELRKNNLTIIKKDNLEDFTGNENLSVKDLLKASAKGTEENYYLDPIPQLNKLGEIYSTLAKNISATISARTDAIKMNREHMDYTNDSAYSGEKVYDLEAVSALDFNGDGVIGIDDAVIGLTIYAHLGVMIGEQDQLFDEIFQYCSIEEAENLDSSIVNIGPVDSNGYGNTVGVYPDNRTIASNNNQNSYYYIYASDKNYKLFLYNNEDSFGTTYYDGATKDEWSQTLLNKIQTLRDAHIDVDATLSAQILSAISKFGEGKSYVTFEQFAEYWGSYKINYYLNLLMPQYKRRVEVEDLNENFWVIGQVLDSVVGTLFGENCLLDTIIALVASNNLTQNTLNSIINYLKELDQQITILQKVSGVGDVNSINWSYKNVVNPKISFYENINMSNFKIVLGNDYGTREINFPISNSGTRNRISYESFTGEEDGIKYLNVFFDGDATEGRENRRHYGVKDCFDKISLLKKSKLPVECLLWRRKIAGNEEDFTNPRCMASFVNVKANEDINAADADTQKRWGYQPYCKTYYAPDTKLTYENISEISSDYAYYYGFPTNFDIVMYDKNYYTYKENKNHVRGGELVLKDPLTISQCLSGVTQYYKTNKNIPVIFVRNDELYNGEIIVLSFKNFSIQDAVPQKDESLSSAYWSTNNRYFYRTSRASAISEQEKYNNIRLLYFNKDKASTFTSTAGLIEKNNFVDVGVVSISDFSIDSISQYTEMNNLSYHHYYNVARGCGKISCYGYSGFSDTDSVFDNTAKGILRSDTAYGYPYDKFYSPNTDGADGNKGIGVKSYLELYKQFFEENKTDETKYDSFNMFKQVVLDQKGKGAIVNTLSNEEDVIKDRSTLYPFAPLAFKIRNFPFMRKAYLNSAKVKKESEQLNWEICAPSSFSLYTIDPQNNKNCASYTSVRYGNESRKGEIAYNLTKENGASVAFDDCLFLFDINWVSNLGADRTIGDNSDVIAYPRIVGFNLYGRSCSGAPGESVPHIKNTDD